MKTASTPWPITQPKWPTVYFTLGTVFNLESGDLFARVLNGLQPLPINLLVTVGPHIDPAEFGPQPENVFITQYIAQENILPHCALVITHGGSGSVGGVLAHGLPSVLIPMGADQPLNAARCVHLGLGQTLDPLALTPESARAAVKEILATPSYSQNAQRLRDEFVALPGALEMVRLIEQLSERR
jgi:MGT family glycosyltransferase